MKVPTIGRQVVLLALEDALQLFDVAVVSSICFRKRFHQHCPEEKGQERLEMG